MRLEAIGYWFNEAAPSAYPRPQALVGPWSAARRAAVVAYLRAGAVFEAYRACSFCRFRCGATARAMGSRDLSDCVWVWPEGLAHYVEVHSVRLPERFVRHALAARLPRATRWPEREGLIDDTRWLAWGRARGASLELAGWEVPGAALRRKIGDALLYRAATRELVVRRPGGRLAIIGRTTRVLAGWHEWPVSTSSDPAPARQRGARARRSRSRR